jgi:hypothetical protein
MSNRVVEYSKDWVSEYAEDGKLISIHHKEGKFYEIIKGPYGNPVSYQKTGGKVFLNIVQGDGEEYVVCEEETIYEDGETPTKQWRIVRASLDNPDQPKPLGEPVFLGRAHSNTARIFGPPDEYYVVHLEEAPEDPKYSLLTFKELAEETADGFGHAAAGLYAVHLGLL